jgi:hypothetical protein
MTPFTGRPSGGHAGDPCRAGRGGPAGERRQGFGRG